ncbi:alcohol dehydrogenase catalytic domain-containing protein [Stigmatella sp. ncwal1]|uniref:Alcohol dehydrogenase catalytic domain-containing protein n=1 Tax=Stigmatella ashevillensis TaxID=2995309 RepID=A0ABT5D597_9BACT|nr:alcohol dehydrogenase catalytic domain-containing protein [Stigmatella ashevillena]MDC0708832.1 alcohol dehydrogenase catalytic domain-containing protein [Stigmatella ashevillena]
MRGVVMAAPGNVCVEEGEDPKIIKPTDAIIRLTATCICLSDLWPYRSVERVDNTPMGHDYVGIVGEIGDEVKTLKVGDFVVGSFVIPDNTCEICQADHFEAPPDQSGRLRERLESLQADHLTSALFSSLGHLCLASKKGHTARAGSLPQPAFWEWRRMCHESFDRQEVLEPR